MTYIKCRSCNRVTFFYSDDCEHCGNSIKGIDDGKSFRGVDDIVQPLYGIGGALLPHYLCPKCHFVNAIDSKVCKDCGQNLSTKELSTSERKKIANEFLQELLGTELLRPPKDGQNSEEDNKE
jgi:hypothetical protein